MDSNFKPGDVVELKSGGPDMTVSAIHEDSAYCEWFDHKNEPQARMYVLAVLKPSKS